MYGVLFTLIACKMQSNWNSYRFECVIRFSGHKQTDSGPLKRTSQLDVNRFIIADVRYEYLYVSIYRVYLNSRKITKFYVSIRSVFLIVFIPREI